MRTTRTLRVGEEVKTYNGLRVLLKSPWRELSVVSIMLFAGFIAMLIMSIGVETPAGGMALTTVVWIMIGSFVLSWIVAMVAVVAGIGGGVIFTPLMLAFTPICSLIIRGTGLVVALFSGMVSAGPFMKSGLGNLKLCIFGAAAHGTGGMGGALSAVWVAKHLGEAGEGIIRVILGLIILGIAVFFLKGGGKVEWPTVKTDRITKWIGLSQPYYEPTKGKVIDYSLTRALIVFLAVFCIGVIGGFFGLGGGAFITATLNFILGAPLKVAAACSGIILGGGGSVAIWPYFLTGAVIPLVVAPWMVGQVIGGVMGAKLLIKIKAAFVRKILIGILFISCWGLVIRGLAMAGVMPEVPPIVTVAVIAGIVILVVLSLMGKFSKERR